MKTYKSPCVAVLGSVADATAAEYPDGSIVRAIANRETCHVELQVCLPARDMAVSHLTLEAIDEVIRDLLAAKADLLKLMHKRPP